MKVVDIADELWRELGEPTSLNIAVIAYWLRTNIGALNSAINAAYEIDTTTQEIHFYDVNADPANPQWKEIGEDEKTILKLLYNIHYYDTQIRRNMLSYQGSGVIEMSSDGQTVRKVSPTEVGKVLASFRNQLRDDLKQFVTWYKINQSKPRQVTGDDFIEGPLESRPIYRRTAPNLYY